jgi:cytochrome b
VIKVWDGFVRISHWLIVLLVISAFVSANFGDAEFKWHSWNGYAIFILVTTRIIWGLVGSTTARFSHFIRSPFHIVYYLRDLIMGKSTHYLGHNPAGAWMVVSFWIVLLVQAITGLFSSDDVVAEGPLTYTVSEDTVMEMTGWHHLIFNVLLVLIALHLAAVIFHQWKKKEKLVQAMFHGKKPINGGVNQKKSGFIFRSIFWAFLILILVASLFYYFIESYL